MRWEIIQKAMSSLPTALFERRATVWSSSTNSASPARAASGNAQCWIKSTTVRARPTANEAIAPSVTRYRIRTRPYAAIDPRITVIAVLVSPTTTVFR